jgi:hypothetical protein
MFVSVFYIDAVDGYSESKRDLLLQVNECKTLNVCIEELAVIELMNGVDYD